MEVDRFVFKGKKKGAAGKMIKVLCILIASFVVLVGCLGFAFAKEIGADSDKAIYFLSVAVITSYMLGYQLVYKEWKCKKSFVFLFLMPVVIAILYNFSR